MIKIHHSTEAGVLQIVEHSIKGCWIDVINPTPDEVKNLTQELSVPLEFISTPLKRDDIAHIEKAGDVLFILVSIPYFRSATANIPYVTLPMGIIVTHEQESLSVGKNTNYCMICRMTIKLICPPRSQRALFCIYCGVSPIPNPSFGKV